MIQSRSTLLFAIIACALVAVTSAFTTATQSLSVPAAASTTARFMSFDDFGQETPEDTKERIQALVDNNPVLLFMKGSKLFPQCGFSNTACQILQSYDIDFHSVDVLSDEAIRQGVKDFSMWPTIPQLYVVCSFLFFLSSLIFFVWNLLSSVATPSKYLFLIVYLSLLLMKQCGEFIGGSDIMIEMYQSGELGEMIEKVSSTKPFSKKEQATKNRI